MVEARVDRLELALERLADAQTRADQRMDRIEAALERLTAAQAASEERLGRVEEHLDRVETRLAQVGEHLGKLAAAQARTEERLAQLTTTQARSEERLEQLAAAQTHTESVLQQLVVTLQRHTERIGQLRGWFLEEEYRRHASAYFLDIVRRLHTLRDEEVATLVEDAQDQGIITEVERRDALRTDMVVRGRRRNNEQPAYLAIEVSAVIDEHDVQRALRRAEVLARASGVTAMPVVAGEEITPEADEHAASRGVWRVLDGRVEAPSEA
jgi:chromosome segregation ATPase